MMRRLFLSLALVMLCVVAMPAPAKAFNPFGNAACSGQNQASAACQAKSSDPITGDNGILLRAANIMAYLGGAIAIIMILVASIRFITSGSDMSTGSRTDTDVEEAKRTITSALIGLAIIILAKVIIGYAIRNL